MTLDEARRNLLGQMTEAEFQAEVLRAARTLGWRPYHTRNSRGSHKGYPDLTLVRGSRLVFAELKSETGRERPEQREWREALKAVAAAAPHAVEVHLWRPSDMDAILTTLGAPAMGRRPVMPKYRKKPVVIEASQWHQHGDHPAVVPIDDNGHDADCQACGHAWWKHGNVKTLEGWHITCPGDWIITGIQGEHYPCKPDIFEQTYEPA